jgi:uncharacterized membrane protein YjgN (DUF898 family)
MQNKSHKFSFEGRAVEYFGLWLINTLLRAVTLGLYYPWAKTNLREFFYSNTKFEGSSFSYHGKGIELFIGLMKALGILLLIFIFGVSLAGTCSYISENPIRYFPNLLIFLRIIWALFITITPFVLLPIALHGSIKYLAQRVSWRGIYFKYNGELKDLIFLYLKYGFLVFMGFAMFFGFSENAYSQKLTIITPTLFLFLAAIFYTTFFVETRGYLFNNITWGNVEVRWYGDGVTFFMLRLRFLFPILLLIFYLHFSSQSGTIESFITSEGATLMILKFVFIFFLFTIVMLFAYIWYLHGYLHFIVSNFRLFQGNTECEVWHESNFGDTLKTWFYIILLVLGALILISIINIISTLAVFAFSHAQNNPSEVFANQSLKLMLFIRVLIFALVMAIVMPFIIMFLMRWVVNGIRIDHNLDVDNLNQNDRGTSEGLGDNLSDMFSIDLV